MFTVFLNTVKTRFGEATLKKHSKDCDAQAFYQELVQHYTSSTTSQIRSDHYLNFISTAKLDSSWKKSLTAFLYTWEDQLRLYEEVTPVNEHYHDPVKRRLLENAVSGNE